VIARAMVWLEGTALATWTRQSPSLWAYPTILTLHTVGLGIVVGASIVIDLRLLGFAPRIRPASLSPLFRMIWYAFGLNALTGVLLFMSDATTKSRQTVFYVKLALIALALWNTAKVRAAILRGADSAAPPRDPATALCDPATSVRDPATPPWDPATVLRDPATALRDPATPSWDPASAGLRTLAVVSMLLWTGAITAGRLMAYF
jgi:hypothetical protein